MVGKKSGFLQKRKRVLIIAAVGLVGLTVFVIVNLFKKQNWQVYKNARYGFNVAYPSSWELGVQEENNAGRSFYPKDNSIYCYAYGFANALTGTSGEPQTLEEFVNWLVNDGTVSKILENSDAKLAGEKAKKLVYEQNDGKIKEAVYSLNQERGLGLYCIYENLQEKNKFGNSFNQIAASFKLEENEDSRTSTQECLDLINGVIEPLADLQTFTDDKYTEVTITSRDAWDPRKLPEKVTQFQSQNYTCYPMPLEFENGTGGAELAVTKVQWTCELKYDTWQYLESGNTSQKTTYENRGYTCIKEDCFLEFSQWGFVWLCYK